MRPGTPLEIKRGYCLGNLEFSQNGKPVNRENTLKHLRQYSASAPHVSTGNGLAIGSIVATLVGTPTLTVGLMGANGTIKMSDDATTALLVTGATIAVASWVLCITSEGQYAAAGEAYNQRFDNKGTATPSDDDAAPQAAAPHPAAPVEREPGDDGDYRNPDSAANAKRNETPAETRRPGGRGGF